MEATTATGQPPVDVVGTPPSSPAKAKVTQDAVKTTPKRKLQTGSSNEVDSMRAPRLSPEPEDDPEGAKRVREKNRLRMYRFNKAVEKRKSSDDGTCEAEQDEGADPLPSPAKPVAAKPKAAEGAVSRPVAVPGGVLKPPKPQANQASRATPGGAPKPPLSPPANKNKAEDGDQAAKSGPRAPPRLSPEPEGATPQEAKRIRAKNRLRVYRYRQAQKKLAGHEEGSPPPNSESEPEPDDEAPRSRDTEVNRRAFHRYQEAAVPYGRASDPGLCALGQLDASTLAAMAQMSATGGILHHSLAQQQHGLAFPAATSNRFSGPASQDPPARKKASKIPKPPRMSPEPEDPKEAKRVRSKNRVRMHRYHQSLAAAQAAAEEKPPAVPSSMTSALQMAAAQAQPYSSPYQFPGFPELPGRGSDWRSMVENQQQTMRLSSFLQDADMMMMRPNYRASDPGSLAAALQAPPAKRQATGKGKGKAPPSFAVSTEEMFPKSLQTVPFGEMTPVLRELALDTYIKETMGMANSLQQLEDQLKVAARHGDTGLQSTALLAAVSQLREDSLGLSRLRMQQYADLVQQSTSVVGKAIMKQKRRSAPGDVRQ